MSLVHGPSKGNKESVEGSNLCPCTPSQFSLFFTPQIRFKIIFDIDSEHCSLDKNMRGNNKEEGEKEIYSLFVF